ncbi:MULTISPECIES: hydrogenase iron-sulfur subunit [Methanobacterium]|uniref:CoB--CoM heterodisulfide reductase iron-sulfur subunit A n=1 Tax=Methanobacterium bryantii TaxID=2161 RepID=A0A2A2H1T6_METBR|nr:MULTISPECIES: hydrogenase iron-sulfur subunit [Methanobacterium]OEC84294.1 disulfide reductase [Methanobacterium sp. A39]PAV03253.1 disulfide reductase [Methanobacterium bryantii]
MSDAKIGVFICQCGGNISGEIDIGHLKNAISDDDVIFIEENPYICSVEGQNKIKESIESSNVDRIVIAACSPNMHEKEFRRCAESAGINQYLLEVANIREQCAWVDKDLDHTARAIDIVNSVMHGVKQAVPHEKTSLSVVKSALVIGGGISGITAALSLARQNIKVYLVEKTPTIGGNMVKVGKVFSADTLSEECAMCSLGPLMGEVAENQNIKIFSQSQVTGVAGHAGNFTVDILTGPKFVDEEKCNACGKCSRACNVVTGDDWNASLSTRKAAYKPFSQAVPLSYTIDGDVCVKCGTCVDSCPAGAIDLDRQATETTLNVGAVIIATGHQELNPEDKEEFGYKKYHDVITQMELARILAVNGPTSGKLVVPSTGKKPHRIVMIQCVGSRDRKEGSIPHCSTICCMVALKHANYIIDHYKGVEIYICYTDMRTPGTYENYYFETQKKGEKTVKFIRGKVAEVKKNKGKFVARVEDTLGGGILDIENDMMVLSCALEPPEDILRIEKALGVSLTHEMFVKEKNSKMEPTQTTVPGIFVCGTAKEAMDVTASINMSRSAASQVAELISQGNIEIEPDFAVINQDRCLMCKECVKSCHSGAVYLGETIQVDPVACSGCGGCISKCQNNAISLPLSSDEDIFARIDGCLSTGTPAVIAFLDKEIAYTAADSMGKNRLNYPSEVRIIKVPSILRLEPKHILHAFKMGAAGIFLGDGTGNAAGSHVSEKLMLKVEELKDELEKAGIGPERIYFYEAYLPHYKGLASKLKEFSSLFKDKIYNKNKKHSKKTIKEI